MRIDVSEILKLDGASLDIEYDGPVEDEEINSIADDLISFGPVSFKGKMVNVGGVLKLEGSLKADYTAVCYRCRRKTERHMKLGIKEDFINASENPDDEAYTYEGKYIDLSRVLKDNIILNLPMKQVCKPECKGLCPKCGTDLNEKECDCREDYINPHMEVLKNFFNN